MSEFLAAHGAELALAPIAFLGALIYGLTGFGSALVTIPLGSHFLPLSFVLAAFAIIDLVNALRLGLQRPRDAVKSEVLRLAPMVIVGLVLGVTALVNLPRTGAMIALGLFVIAYAVYSLVRRGAPRVIDQRWAYVAGLAGGVAGALFGAGGPPYAIYLSQRGLSNAQFRATLAFASIISISLRAIVFFLSGLFAQPGLWIAILAALPAALLGMAVASHMFVRLSRETLTRLIALMLLGAGGSLLVRALA